MGDIVWHGHHENVCPLEELLGTIRQRKQDIIYRKQQTEHATRLRLLKLASPEAVAAFRAYQIALNATWDSHQAERRGRSAGAITKNLDETFDADYKTLVAPILALHATECVPDCPWDGQRIVFPQGDTP